jgi:hypothetical protein
MIEDGYIKAEYERGKSYPIALVVVSRRLRIVRPSSKILYNDSDYETWWYPMDIDVLLYLDSFPSAGRVVTLPICRLDRSMCRKLKEIVENLWIEEGRSERDVEVALESISLWNR